MNGKEAFVQVRGIVKENALRAALGASLAINAGIVADTGLNDAEIVKGTVGTMGDLSEGIVRTLSDQHCFAPFEEEKFPESCETNGNTIPFRIW